jgi:hypothetical protein
MTLFGVYFSALNEAEQIHRGIRELIPEAIVARVLWERS